jgi:dimethylhistidine N-methyltransferase
MSSQSPEQSYRVLDPSDPSLVEGPSRAFAEEVLIGLSERPKRLPSRYIYDDRGSRLFQQITELDEYYPTACEFEVFRDHHAELLDRFRRQPFNLIDLGAGDGRKTAVLLEYLVEAGADVRYVPIDISEEAMRIVVDTMRARFPTLKISGLVADYFDGLRWLSKQTDRRNLVLFLGSNIGNFNKPRARAFLRRLWSSLNPADRVLIGFDLKKDIEVLLSAYNDREGTTAKFNLNLLERINRELGGTFDINKFRHFSTYNVFTGAMESYLVSQVEQRVFIEALSQDFHFRPWEPIHTEYSYKYLDHDISDLAEFTRFAVEAKWYDSKGWFCDALWRVEKG